MEDQIATEDVATKLNADTFTVAAAPECFVRSCSAFLTSINRQDLPDNWNVLSLIDTQKVTNCITANYFQSYRLKNHGFDRGSADLIIAREFQGF